MTKETEARDLLRELEKKQEMKSRYMLDLSEMELIIKILKAILFVVVSVNLQAQHRGDVGQPGGGGVSVSNSQAKRLSADASTTSTTFADITDLSFDVDANTSYCFIILHYVEASAGGVRIRMSGTATANSFRANTATALGDDYWWGTGASTNTVVIHGSIDVNTAGTLKVEFAQYDTDGGTTYVREDSHIIIIQAQ